MENSYTIILLTIWLTLTQFPHHSEVSKSGKFHGGKSSGPVTELGRQIYAAAKTIHCKDTRADRQVHRLAMKRLRLYAQILGVPFRSDAGDKRPKYLR